MMGSVRQWLQGLFSSMNGYSVGSRGSASLGVKITVGNEESAKHWSDRMGRKIKVGDVVDLGKVSETPLDEWKTGV